LKVKSSKYLLLSVFYGLLFMGFEAINLRRFILAKRVIKNPTTSVVGFLILLMRGIRTDPNADVRGTSACRRS
jgi:hypothetical protein